MTAYFAVVGFGARGAPHRTPDAAWESFYRATGVAHRPWQQAGMVRRCSAVLCEATTRRAALDADVSATSGRVGRGEWQRVGMVE